MPRPRTPRPRETLLHVVLALAASLTIAAGPAVAPIASAPKLIAPEPAPRSTAKPPPPRRAEPQPGPDAPRPATTGSSPSLATPARATANRAPALAPAPAPTPAPAGDPANGRAALEEGLQLVERKCAKCHALSLAIGSELSPGQWKLHMKRMANRPGAAISEDQARLIHEFLQAWYAQRP